MPFFTQGVATVKVWEFILLMVAVLISAIFIMSYISTKMEEKSAKKTNQLAPNTGVPASPQLAPSAAATNTAASA
jgi:uncharacterized protein (UPF0333 family)